MQAGDVTLGKIFANYQQNVIPLFQRPYVWAEEKNWQPLWDDIRLASEEQKQLVASPSGSGPRRTYFLGAIVLQTRPKTSPKQVHLWNVVDGQQRLTTLQVLFASARVVALGQGFTTLAAKFRSLIENPDEIIDQSFPNDRYKIWPLPQDRDAFLWCIAPERFDECPDPEHRLAKAKQWFTDTLGEWTYESPDPEARLDTLFETLKERMELVQIELGVGDDPQVIFEVLNHRGVPLDAADLIKNLLFQQFDHSGAQSLAEQLLLSTWLPLDKKPWRDEITTGRVKRKKIDLLLAYWLAIETGEEVSVDHLFADFKRWLKSTAKSTEDTIRSIRHYADRMLYVQSLPLTHPAGQFLDRMEATQTTTPWPLLLYLYADDKIPKFQKELAVDALDSFTMRRAICRYTSKDYNKLFLSVLVAAKGSESEAVGETIIEALLRQDAESRRWPTDEEFIAALHAPNLFNVITRARLKSLLLGIENHLHTDKVETSLISARDQRLNVELLMPQSWQKYWPLNLQPGDEGYEPKLQIRQAAIHSLGNLTILTTKLNPSVSNNSWQKKKKEIGKHSLLRLTTSSVLTAPDSVSEMDDDEWSKTWDEERIYKRAEWLRDQALVLWPLPWDKGQKH